MYGSVEEGGDVDRYVCTCSYLDMQGMQADGSCSATRVIFK